MDSSKTQTTTDMGYLYFSGNNIYISGKKNNEHAVSEGQ